MPKRFVTLPNGRRVSLRAYVKAWRALLSAPPGARYRGFADFEVSGADILAEMRAALHKRINGRGALTIREARAHPATYAAARSPRVRLAPDQFASLSRHAKRRLAERAPA